MQPILRVREPRGDRSEEGSEPESEGHCGSLFVVDYAGPKKNGAPSLSDRSGNWSLGRVRPAMTLMSPWASLNSPSAHTMKIALNGFVQLS